ncbi:hypothetical protein IWQ60_010088 [Tieghemiomyces parasiticus]|uniref:Uncharacterized protein n=1 Tax=Tieghemiomyces parasiticus TaxID=78921 RepID=A0A9W7ZMH6_9FUNG|nr:hypothetical protein IWQ60_010088 [Tieghemiomyces parasiticus]
MLAQQYVTQSLQAEPYREQPLPVEYHPSYGTPSEDSQQYVRVEPSTQTLTDVVAGAGAALAPSRNRSRNRDSARTHDSSPDSRHETSSHGTTDDHRSRTTDSPAPRHRYESPYYDQEKHELRYAAAATAIRVPVRPSTRDHSRTPTVAQPHTLSNFPSSASTHVTESKPPGDPDEPDNGSVSSLGTFPMFSRAMYIQPNGRIPFGAACFLFGFLFFPCWWIGSVYPRHSKEEVDIIWKRYNRWFAAFSLLLLAAILACVIWYAVHDT